MNKWRVGKPNKCGGTLDEAFRFFHGSSAIQSNIFDAIHSKRRILSFFIKKSIIFDANQPKKSYICPDIPLRTEENSFPCMTRVGAADAC
jgi:hypothetical protein